MSTQKIARPPSVAGKARQAASRRSASKDEDSTSRSNSQFHTSSAAVAADVEPNVPSKQRRRPATFAYAPDSGLFASPCGAALWQYVTKQVTPSASRLSVDVNSALSVSGGGDDASTRPTVDGLDVSIMRRAIEMLRSDTDPRDIGGEGAAGDTAAVPASECVHVLQALTQHLPLGRLILRLVPETFHFDGTKAIKPVKTLSDILSDEPAAKRIKFEEGETTSPHTQQRQQSSAGLQPANDGIVALTMKLLLQRLSAMATSLSVTSPSVDASDEAADTSVALNIQGPVRARLLKKQRDAVHAFVLMILHHQERFHRLLSPCLRVLSLAGSVQHLVLSSTLNLRPLLHDACQAESYQTRLAVAALFGSAFYDVAASTLELSAEESTSCHNIMSLNARLCVDPDPRVRSEAMRALSYLVSRAAAQQKDATSRSLLSSFKRSILEALPLIVSGLGDDQPEVRCSAAVAATEIACLFPKAKIDNTTSAPASSSDTAQPADDNSKSRQQTARLIDHCFVKVSDLVNDVLPQVRVSALSCLSRMTSAREMYVRQTFDKKLMSHFSMRKSTHDKLKEKHGRALPMEVSVDEPKSSEDSGEDITPEGDIDVHNVAIVASGACGAFVHGLEDEFSEVRLATVKAIRAHCLKRPKLHELALDYLVDMFNDEIDDVRLAAIETLTSLARYVTLREEQLEVMLGILEDNNPAIRHGAHDLLASSQTANSNCLHVVVQALVQNLRKYQQDASGIFRVMCALGLAHPQFVELLTGPLLHLNVHFVQTEPNVEDNVYTALVVLVANAASKNGRITQLFPHYLGRHLVYLHSKHPLLIPSPTVSSAEWSRHVQLDLAPASAQKQSTLIDPFELVKLLLEQAQHEARAKQFDRVQRSLSEAVAVLERLASGEERGARFGLLSVRWLKALVCVAQAPTKADQQQRAHALARTSQKLLRTARTNAGQPYERDSLLMLADDDAPSLEFLLTVDLYTSFAAAAADSRLARSLVEPDSILTRVSEHQDSTPARVARWCLDTLSGHVNTGAGDARADASLAEKLKQHLQTFGLPSPELEQVKPQILRATLRCVDEQSDVIRFLPGLATSVQLAVQVEGGGHEVTCPLISIVYSGDRATAEIAAVRVTRQYTQIGDDGAHRHTTFEGTIPLNGRSWQGNCPVSLTPGLQPASISAPEAADWTNLLSRSFVELGPSISIMMRSSHLQVTTNMQT